MVSPRIQHESQRNDEDTTSQRSATTYQSAQEFGPSFKGRGSHPPSPSGGQLRRGPKWSRTSLPPSRSTSVGSRSSHFGSSRGQKVAQWRQRVALVQETGQSPASRPQAEDHVDDRPWFEGLNVEDDLLEGFPKITGQSSSRFDREQTEAASDVMKPIPTYFESQNDLRAAMENLTTRSRKARSPSVSSGMDLCINGGATPELHEDDESKTFLRTPGVDTRYEKLLDEVRDLASGLSEVNDTLADKLSSVLDRLTQLEGRVTSTSSQTVPGIPKKKLSTFPRRRSETSKQLARGVRKEVDALLDRHNNSPFVSEAAADTFTRAVKRNPETRCCGLTNFQIDTNGGCSSPWNQSLALVFTEHYLAKNKLEAGDADRVKAAFLTRVKTIKQSLVETPKQKANKAEYIRKYNLFQRRVEAVASLPMLHRHLPLLQKLSVDGMSSDEEDSEDDMPTALSKGRMVKNPNYHVLTPQWRSRELTMFLHVLDSVYLIKRRLERQRGSWPRPRSYDPNRLRLSQKTTFPQNLPENAYDGRWLRRFPNIKLSVNPTSRYDFTHSPEVFQFLLSPDIHEDATSDV